MFSCLVCADLMLRHLISNIFFFIISLESFLLLEKYFFKKQNFEMQTLKFSNLNKIKTNKPKTNKKYKDKNQKQ